MAAEVYVASTGLLRMHLTLAGKQLIEGVATALLT